MQQNEALEALRSGQLSGGVISVDLLKKPEVEGTLKNHVRSTIPLVEDLLDSLLGNVTVVDGWTDGVAKAQQTPRRYS